jgi:membrane protein YdbS with pleckstrin-like domain
MAKIDRARDFINNIRLYMTMCLALIISIGSGITKIYLSDNFSYLFFMGNIVLILLFLIFVFLAKKLHQKTDELKDIN